MIIPSLLATKGYPVSPIFMSVSLLDRESSFNTVPNTPAKFPFLSSIGIDSTTTGTPLALDLMGFPTMAFPDLPAIK